MYVGTKVLLTMLALLFIFTSPVMAQSMVKLPYEAIYQVEPGDSLYAIAGEQYMAIYENNRSIIAEANGCCGDISPHRILSCTVLTIPEGAYVTFRVAQIVNNQPESQEKADMAIRQAKSRYEQLTSIKGESAGGLSLLQKAVSAYREKGELHNFDAYVWADQASKVFADVVNLTMTTRKIEEAKEQQDIAMAAMKDKADILLWGLTGLTLLLVSIVMTIIYMQIRARSRRRMKNESFMSEQLAYHRKRLTEIESV